MCLFTEQKWKIQKVTRAALQKYHGIMTRRKNFLCPAGSFIDKGSLCGGHRANGRRPLTKCQTNPSPNALTPSVGFRASTKVQCSKQIPDISAEKEIGEDLPAWKKRNRKAMPL
jgi:hypothetical protein